MSAISLKSISGITSITTPAGVDNQLTLHNNNTTEAVKLDTAGNLHFHNHLNITGVSTASNFKTGTSNLHNTGLNVFDLDVDGHTNLDNVNVSGITTFANNVHAANVFTSYLSSSSALVAVYADIDDYVDVGSNIKLGNAGIITATGADINGDLDVDGHTNLDNVSIAGVSTFIGNISVGGNFTASRKVHIKDSGQIRLENTSTGAWAGLEWLVSSGTNNYDAYMGLQDSDGLFFIDNNSNGIDFCITQGGKIGINQTAPYADVDITSSVEDTDDSALSAHGIRLAHVGATDEEVIPITAGFVTQQARARAAIGFISKTISGAAGMGGAIGFYTRNTADGHALYRADEKLRITEAGKVGIGTDNPKQWVSMNSGRVSIDIKADYYGAWIDGDSSGTSSFNVGRWHNAGGRMRSGGSNDNDLVVETQNTSHNLQLQPSGGKVGIGDDDPVVKLHVKGSGDSHATLNVHTSIEDTTSYAANVGGLQVFEGRYNSANSPAVFSAIHGGKENATDGNYAGYLRFLTRAQGAMPVERARIASNGFMGVNTTNPQTELNVIGSISAGRNVAKELGTIINISSNHNAPRSGGNVISGQKNYETGSNDWLAAGGSRVNANLTIDLGTAISCDRFVIYNQNEYDHSNREVKNFTLEGSNDNSSWTTVLDDDCGCSHGHEPNPGFSFRIPAGNIYGVDDNEGLSYRYWRFTMKTFHGSDSYGGVCELELYQTGTSTNAEHVGSEVTTSSLVAGDVHTERLDGLKMITSSKGLNIHTGEDASDTWEITETQTNTNGSYYDKSTIRHKRGVMAVSSAYNTGDLFIRIDNLYNLPGNAWWTFGVLILSDEVVGTLAGHHSYVTAINIHGLGSWSSISKHDIRGTMTVSVSSHGSNFIELFINVNDSSRGPCTVICNGGTFDPPRISFH